MIEQLILVRHGETLHNVAGIVQGWGDSALSELGQQQVQRLAGRVAALRPNAIFSSPLDRAMATARPIAAATSLQIQTLDDLREICLGDWEGLSYADVRRDHEAAFRRWIDDPDAVCPQGESHNDVLRRMQRAFEHIAASGNGQPLRAVVVTHGTAIRIAATALLNLPVTASRRFAQDNAAVNIFTRRGERWILRLWNDVGTMNEEG